MERETIVQGVNSVHLIFTLIYYYFYYKLFEKKVEFITSC